MSEINKAIAQAKGWTDFEYEWVGEDKKLCGIPPGYKFRVVVSDYESDLNDAIELLWELPGFPVVRTEISAPPFRRFIFWGMPEHGTPISDDAPESFARAICEAWLTAKGIEIPQETKEQ